MSAPLPSALRTRFQRYIEEGLSGRAAALRLKLSPAMIYSEEAPALEAALHSEFGDRRVNAANLRKEFFRASLAEVENAVHRLAPDAEFHKDIEAQEFRETLARRKQQLEAEKQDAELEFPEEI